LHPGALRFTYSPTGRPSLVDAKLPLDFNLSHAGGVALYALSLRGPVGVDIESIRPQQETLAAIRRCLADEERAALERESEERQTERLYAWWACKEALLKASGWGLSVDPVQIVMRFADNDTARFLCRDPRLAGDGWVARLVDPLAGYVAAVCSRHPAGPVRLRTWGQEFRHLRATGRAGV
jgi:4'-phosphopantetheinyl transferase